MSSEGQVTEAKPEEAQGTGAQQVEAKPSEAGAEGQGAQVLELLARVNSKKPNIPKEALKKLKLSIKMRRERPDFIRTYSRERNKARLEDSPWRRPKGIDNKIRMKRKGYPPIVRVGYRGPSDVRGLHPSGFQEVLVHRPEDLAKVDPERQAVRIASTVGLRKRVEIVREAVKRGIKVLNVTKDVLEALKRG